MKVLKGALAGVAGLAAVMALAGPASAAITTAGGSNAQPVAGGGNNNPAFNCPAGSRWVYVSTTSQADYNALSPYTTDSLGADAKNTSGMTDKEDLYNDGVTLAYTADGKGVVVGVNEGTDATTTITLTKLVVKTGNDLTAYTGSDLTTGTKDPAINNLGVSHAFLCYTVAPTPVVPEVPYAILLPASAAVLAGGVYAVRRRKLAAI